MLSFAINSKIEKKLINLNGLLAETYKGLESLSPEEAGYLHRFKEFTHFFTKVKAGVKEPVCILWRATVLC